MKKLIFKNICIIIGMLVFISSCSPEQKSGNTFTETRDFSNCFEQIDFNLKVQTFTHFFPETEELTIREKLMTLPKFEYFTVKICTSQDGHYKIETNSLPELASQLNLPDNTVGIHENLKWKSINVDGNLTTYDENNEEIENSNAQNLTVDAVSKISNLKALPLNHPEHFAALMNELKSTLQITDLPNGDYLITTLIDNKKVETVMSKEFQREVSQTFYDENNIINSSKQWSYKIANNKTILFLETFNAYMNSFDSNKTLVISKVKEYTFN